MSCSFVLNKQSVKSLVSTWLSNEPSINYVGFSSKNSNGTAIIRMKTPGVLAGVPFVDAIFKESSCKADWHVTEGQMVDIYSKHVATVTGANEDLLFCENIVLSILSRASGIASLARRLKQSLSNSTWKGDLRMPKSLTPGFGLVEEYAMTLAGVTTNTSAVTIRQSHVLAAGGIQKAIQSIRSKIGANRTIEVECINSGQATEAAKAGADLIFSDNLSLKEMTTIATNLKSSFPKVTIQFNGSFDDSDVKSFALNSFDFLSTTKLCNGYSFINFQVAYEENKVNSHENKNNEADSVALKSPPPAQAKPKSPVPEPVVEVDSSTASAPKKSRLADSEGASPKLSNSNDAVSARNSNPPVSGSNWSPSANAVNTSNQMSKRAQRNQRNAPHQRQNAARNQSQGGMQFLQAVNQRTNASPANRSPGMLQQPSLNLGVLMATQSPPGMRPSLSQQQQQQRGLQSNMMGAAQALGGGFLNMQGSQQPNWQMLSGGGGGANNGPLVGGIGLGMRLGGPGNMGSSNCRSCGTLNGPGLIYCRNCRVPLR